MSHSNPAATADRSSQLWRTLALACGGLDAVDTLTDEALPDEPFDRSAVPPQLSERVSEVLRAVDGFCESELDVEFRTAMRRVLAQATRHSPDWFGGRQTPQRLAAAVAWVTLSGNFALGRRRHHWCGEDIWYRFGVSSAAELGRRLADRLGMRGDEADSSTLAFLDDMQTDIRLGDAALLRSGARRHLINLREIAIDVDEQIATRRERAGPVHYVGDDRIEVRGRPRPVIGAFKGTSAEGRAHVMLAFGDDVEGTEVLAVTIPDARTLIQSIRGALDAPMVLTP